jgi:hypothetical protein
MLEMMIADVIMEAAGRAGGEPFTLGWLMCQPGVRQRVGSEARMMTVLREMTDAGMLREVTRHPLWRWAVIPLSGD